jgi:hypothetical protein
MWHIWGRGEVNTVMMGKPEGKRPVIRPRSRCEDNIKADLMQILREGVDYIDLAEDTEKWLVVEDKGMNFQVTLNAGNF